MGLIIPKCNADPQTLDLTLKVYYDADNWVENAALIESLSQLLANAGIESEKKEPQSYTKKTQVLSYYGFLEWENPKDSESKRRITETGKLFYEHRLNNNNEDILELLIRILGNNTFGRNVLGCNSDSDLEAPNIFLKCALLLQDFTKKEFAYVLQRMEFDNAELIDCIFDVSLKRKANLALELNSNAAKWTDPKPILALGDWGLFEVSKHGQTDVYNLSQNVIEKYSQKLLALRTKNNEPVRFNFLDADNEDFLCLKEDAFQKIFFGAPGTGKSFQLNEMSAPFESQKKPHIDEAALIKAAVEDAKRKPGKLTLLNAIGFKYSSFLSGKSIKELQNITGYDKVGEFLTGAAAATIYPSIKIDEGRETDVDHVKEWLTDEKRGENDLLKWLNAVGFVFSDCVGSFQQNELQKTFGLSSYAQAYWLYQGAKVAKMDLSKEIDEEVRFVERVTFHPNYSYAQFVGTYKPVQDEDDSKAIVYSYVPGPFMRTYVRAKRAKQNGTDEKFLLIIEEINRANVAAVFGDVFQLLDRKQNGESEYPIAASEDIKRYLKDNGIDDCNELKIPSNMYIWATMNSADQGVFPMDTAFKRRWEFEYIGVDDNQQTIENFEIPMQKNADGSHEWMKWNELRTKINDKLTDLGINEDKLLGPFFISLEKLQSVDNHNESEAENFVKAFKSKVLMYLFEDAVKMKAPSFFNCDKMRYSEICKKFDTDGIGVFNF